MGYPATGNRLEHPMLKILGFGMALATILAPAAANACMSPHVIFAYGSARLTPHAHATVGRVAEALRNRPGTIVELAADSDGSRPNLQMTRRRTDAIRAALMRRGVAANRIKTDAVRRAGPKGWHRVVWLNSLTAPSC